jgi:hypothetical protein
MRPGFSGGTERPTHERRDDADPFFGDAEGLRIRLECPSDSLGLVPDGELVTVARCSAVADPHQGSAVRCGLERGAHRDRHRLTEGCDLAGIVWQCDAAEVGQHA